MAVTVIGKVAAVMAQTKRKRWMRGKESAREREREKGEEPSLKKTKIKKNEIKTRSEKTLV